MGSFGHLGTVQPHDPLQLSKMRGSLPVLVNSNMWVTDSPSSNVPKSCSYETNDIVVVGADGGAVCSFAGSKFDVCPGLVFTGKSRLSWSAVAGREAGVASEESPAQLIKNNAAAHPVINESFNCMTLVFSKLQFKRCREQDLRIQMFHLAIWILLSSVIHLTRISPDRKFLVPINFAQSSLLSAG